VEGGRLRFASNPLPGRISQHEWFSITFQAWDTPSWFNVIWEEWPGGSIQDLLRDLSAYFAGYELGPETTRQLLYIYLQRHGLSATEEAITAAIDRGWQLANPVLAKKAQIKANKKKRILESDVLGVLAAAAGPMNRKGVITALGYGEETAVGGHFSRMLAKGLVTCICRGFYLPAETAATASLLTPKCYIHEGVEGIDTYPVVITGSSSSTPLTPELQLEMSLALKVIDQTVLNTWIRSRQETCSRMAAIRRDVDDLLSYHEIFYYSPSLYRARRAELVTDLARHHVDLGHEVQVRTAAKHILDTFDDVDSCQATTLALDFLRVQAAQQEFFSQFPVCMRSIPQIPQLIPIV
jgi:hypothetical protein